MLGQDLMVHLAARHEVLGLERAEADITNADQVLRAVKTKDPEVVIHAAAFTAVDDCERRPELAFQVNAEGTRNLAMACREWHLPVLYVSTDYVFDGEKPTPYVEQDTPNPINVYGRSKFEGERYVQGLLERYWIVRTSWLFGRNGKNFVRTILGKARRGEPLRVVDDQIGSPTYTADLAKILGQILEMGKPGIYHATNQGHCSWFEFAREALRQAGLDQGAVSPMSSSELDCPAIRPENSRLADTRLRKEGMLLLPLWQDALGRYMEIGRQSGC
jgi:dTDP-4-dehydrorhamnose reductase